MLCTNTLGCFVSFSEVALCCQYILVSGLCTRGRTSPCEFVIKPFRGVFRRNFFNLSVDLLSIVYGSLVDVRNGGGELVLSKFLYFTPVSLYCSS